MQKLENNKNFLQKLLRCRDGTKRTETRTEGMLHIEALASYVWPVYTEGHSTECENYLVKIFSNKDVATMSRNNPGQHSSTSTQTG